MEALLAVPRPADADALRHAYAFLRAAQASTELPAPAPAGRRPVLGGWCMSGGEHRWPVSDCTAEAITALSRAERDLGHSVPSTERIPAGQIRQAVAFILDRQNSDGGFGSYERRHAPLWLEAANPSEMFSQCMVEGSYIECTGSALTALTHALPRCDSLRIQRRVAQAVDRGALFLRRRQRPDGSFAASWGINFTYATFLALRGLRAAGLAADDPTLARAANWLRAAQRPDGGWGEHYSSCLTGSYVEHREGQPVMTAWALLGLLELTGPDDQAVARGVRWLCSQQQPDGSWHQQAVTGVFFGTGMLHYRLYAAYFPAWALGRYLRKLQPDGASASVSPRLANPRAE
jgi:squalene/oxidosqualene cyclase-like protein